MTVSRLFGSAFMALIAAPDAAAAAADEGDVDRFAALGVNGGNRRRAKRRSSRRRRGRRSAGGSRGARGMGMSAFGQRTWRESRRDGEGRQDAVNGRIQLGREKYKVLSTAVLSTEYGGAISRTHAHISSSSNRSIPSPSSNRKSRDATRDCRRRRRRKDADDQERDCKSSAPAAAAEPVGSGEQRHQPERREPDQPAQAARAAAVVAVDLRPGEIEGDDDDVVMRCCGDSAFRGSLAGGTPALASQIAAAGDAEQPKRREREKAVVADEHVEGVEERG